MKDSKGEVPRHIGIIPDGNRRFAKRLMMKPWKGHEWGAQKLEKILDWCKEFGVKELTFYVLSLENFDRPKEEFDFLMDVFRDLFDRFENDKRIYDDKIRINIVGRTWMLPKDIQEKIKNIMEKTKDHNRYIINFAMAYGGRAEVVDAARKIAEGVKEGKIDVKKINEEVFSDNLYLKDEPDLIIRTSENRLSGFLPWQSTYAEVIFLPDLLWPEFEKKHFVECIEEYARRKRRFGK